MAAGAQERWQDQPSRRRKQRYRVQASLDVTVLRSGIPDTLPGRLLNLGEGGVAAVLAGELLPGEAVALEICLPPAADVLRMRALVRHHDKLRHGMEFLGLSREQQTAIRVWTGRTKPEPDVGVRPKTPNDTANILKNGTPGAAPPPARKRGGKGWILAAVLAAILLAGLWWHWNRGWEEIESGLSGNGWKRQPPRPEAHVPADVMQKLVIHRVDPDYPDAARPEKLQGVVVLNVVVGSDGSVVDVRAVNGPEILTQAAMNALRWWRFEPYRIDGRPVVVETTVAVEFKP